MRMLRHRVAISKGKSEIHMLNSKNSTPKDKRFTNGFYFSDLLHVVREPDFRTRPGSPSDPSVHAQCADRDAVVALLLARRRCHSGQDHLMRHQSLGSHHSILQHQKGSAPSLLHTCKSFIIIHQRTRIYLFVYLNKALSFALILSWRCHPPTTPRSQPRTESESNVRLSNLKLVPPSQVPNSCNELSLRKRSFYGSSDLTPTDPKYRQWALNIDKSSRFLFPLAFLLFNTFYWPILLSR
ncbi:neur_chan_memb domain-containing protein [Caerostris extrusa]|uniref:Neur_chan_memb domain-containing protein n=1 Tax=Caerostris extrusa TaxID=172846 RepID=A0AAV4PDP6_CAEEX|nr:neur_chan_memb domain-containing protein [Caerostris extrusa]